MKRAITLAVLFALAFCVGAEPAQSRVGYAYDKQGETLLYTEHHHELRGEGLVRKSRVLYKKENGAVFAEKTLDFTTDFFLPEFSLVNKQTGHNETTRYVDENYQVSFIKSHESREKQKPLSYTSGAISDAGFDNFVTSHWDELTSGKEFTRDFLIPGLLRFFKFRIYQDSVVEEDDSRYRVLHIEPANFFLRKLAGTSRLYYEHDWPELKKFRGISNMRDENGDNYKVTIIYEKSAFNMNADNSVK